jgi:hypothetical protein
LLEKLEVAQNMAEQKTEWHDPRCALSLRSPATGKYVPEHAKPQQECICKDLQESRLASTPSPSLKSSLKQCEPLGLMDDLGYRGGEEALPDVDIASPVRRRRPSQYILSQFERPVADIKAGTGFDAKPPIQAWPTKPLMNLKVLDIAESLIRLGILSALLFSAETQPEVPISKMTPPLEMIRALGEGEASLMEEATRQSHHDFVASVKSYIRMLPTEELYDRMMNTSTLVSLPRSLKSQIARYNRALETYDTLSLKHDRDERHRLIVDRRRLQDEYQALRWLEQRVIELQREEGFQSSIIVILNIQLDLLVPDFSALNRLLKTKAVVELLK